MKENGVAAAVAVVRSLLAFVCLLTVCVLVPVSTVGWWVRDTLVETDEYVATVGPLASDPEVQAATEELLVSQTMAAIDRLDLTSRLRAALEGRNLPRALRRQLEAAEANEADLEATVEALVTRLARRIVTSPAYAEAWESSHRALHEQLIATLSDDLPPAASEDGPTISLELAVLSTALREALVEAGIPGAARLPVIQASLPIVETERLERAQRAYRLLDRWGAWLPWITAGLAVLGLLVARRRLTSLAWTGLGSAVTVVGTAGALLLFGPGLVTRGIPAAQRDVATSVAQVLADELLTLLWWLAGACVVVAVVGGIAAVVQAWVRSRRA